MQIRQTDAAKGYEKQNEQILQRRKLKILLNYMSLYLKISMFIDFS
jgi:hypothetical protein